MERMAFRTGGQDKPCTASICLAELKPQKKKKKKKKKMMLGERMRGKKKRRVSE